MQEKRWIMTEELRKEKEKLEALLKGREKKFAHLYIASDYNGTAAAIEAGYKEKSARQQASRLLTNANIAAYVRILQLIAIEESGLSPEYITRKRMEILDRCLQAVPVEQWDYTEGKKVPTGKYIFDAKNALKALEALEKTVEGGKAAEGVTVKYESPELEEWSQ